MSTKYPKYENFQQKKKQSYYDKLSDFYRNSKRILKIANKPNRKEYFLVFKICGIGLIVLGVLSYVIQIIFRVAIPPGK